MLGKQEIKHVKNEYSRDEDVEMNGVKPRKTIRNEHIRKHLG